MNKTCTRLFKRLANNRGNMLLLSYFVIIVMLGLGAAFTLMSVNEMKVAERNRLETVAFNIAEAGIEHALYDLRQDFVTDPTPDWADGWINTIDISANGGPDTSSFYELYAPASFNGGNYEVDLMNVAGEDDIWVRSTGTVNDITQSILVYVKMVNLSPWDNAIFAGAGAAGAMINGNVDIRGSVHILGDSLAPGDYAMDLGGTAQLVGNNYNGLDAGLKALVPALPTVIFNGENVETLQAELRVKKGKIGLSGTATVGELDSPGDSTKETVDGVYVVDGDPVNDYGGTGGAASVYSDNGVNNGYDLGDSIEFPSLADPYDGHANYRAYLVDGLGALVVDDPGDLADLANIDPNETFTVGNCATNCIKMDGATGEMTINGVVVIDPNVGAGLDGDLNMEIDGADTTITYSGKGTIYVSGDVQIDLNLVTSGVNSYPNNIVGIMTPNDISMKAAGIDVMGLFYAEDEITVTKQTDILGTIVSNYFDMGTNVPSIFQVPEVMDNLPAGLISANAYWYVQVMWQKI